MHIRQAVLEDDVQVADAGTYTLDLNTRDPITELLLRFSITNSAAINNESPVEIHVTKIEIVDGGREIWSTYGELAVAQGCFDTGKWPMSGYNENLSNDQVMHFPLRFGRYLGDQEFGFDPSKLLNPQLKVTFVDHANHAADGKNIGVVAQVMEGGASPPKCLVWREIETFTSVASGVKVVEMPVENPYRRLAIRCYLKGDALWRVFSHYKFDCDVGKLVLFDLDSDEFADLTHGMFGPYSYNRIDRIDNASTKEAWMGTCLSVAISAGAADDIVSAFPSNNPFFYTYACDTTPTNQTDVQVQVGLTGFNPHNTRGYQFGRADHPETWFRASQYKDIDLKLTQGAAGDECTVAVQVPITL